MAELFPRHIQIHYGQYRREELFEAARRSRDCAYFADDDHGPLAPQEILLAGRPTVGVRMGASFVRDGATGYVVERLPPGRQCVMQEDDETALSVYMDALRRARDVRAQAAGKFATACIVNAIIGALSELRSVDFDTLEFARTGLTRSGPSTAAVTSG